MPTTPKTTAKPREEGLWLLNVDGQVVGMISEERYGEKYGLESGASLSVAYSRVREQFQRTFPELAESITNTSISAKALLQELRGWEKFIDVPSPLNRHDLLKWFAEQMWEPDRGVGFGPVILLGRSPFEQQEIAALCQTWNVEHYVEDEVCSPKSAFYLESDLAPLFVIGRSTSEERITSLIRWPEEWLETKKSPFGLVHATVGGSSMFYRSQPLEIPHFYSQEMFLYRLFTRRDPLGAAKGFLDIHAQGHPGVICLIKNSGFPWVSTEVGLSLGGVLSENGWPKVGLLKHMGYSVGRDGLAAGTRRSILARIYESSDLPTVVSTEYMAKWGLPRSSQRLHQLAQCIASFSKLRKRSATDSSSAVADWEEDLDWLKSHYYKGHFDHRFTWPG